MQKLLKNTKLNLFTYIEIIFAFAVNTVVIAINLGFKKGVDIYADYIIFNMFSFLTLFVTALGVTGIQLIQIYRKKNEIGLRRAIGARDVDILLLILKNTLLLIFIPAVIGSMLGVILSKILPLNEMWVEARIDYRLIILCIIAIMLFSIISGILPAAKALHINTIEVLRKTVTYERKKARKTATICFYTIIFTVILTGAYINYRLEADYKQDILNTTGSPPAPSEEVPDFSYKDESGEVISSEAFKGNSYCLVIYDLACPATPLVFDNLKVLLAKGIIGADNIYAICLDEPSIDEVDNYLEYNNLAVASLIDHKKSTKWAFNVSRVPTVYIIDSNGVISARSIGWSEDLEQYINKEIEESMSR